MSERSDATTVLLAGVGGQGVLLIGQVIAQAALRAGRQVKMNEVHGMAQRGGSVLAQVRYGERVYSPVSWEAQADIIVSLERIESLRYAKMLKPGGKVVSSDEAIVPVTVSSGAAAYPQDVRALAAERFSSFVLIDAVGIASALGNRKAANMVLAGSASLSLELPLEAFLESIRAIVPEKHRELNLKAFEAGRKAL
jgi:indolepyruvate ferredoxin oxidoreductase beta subunit